MKLPLKLRLVTRDDWKGEKYGTFTVYHIDDADGIPLVSTGKRANAEMLVNLVNAAGEMAPDLMERFDLTAPPPSPPLLCAAWCDGGERCVLPANHLGPCHT